MTPALAHHINALEARVHRAADEAGIDPDRWRPFFQLLDRLKVHNPRMYAHSLRVGLYAAGLARQENQPDLKLPLFGGCGHDIGKARVSNRILDANTLTDAGFNRVQAHSRHGFEHWKEKHFLYTAFVAGLHHRFQEGGYGINLESDSPIPLTKQDVATIHAAVSLVTTADFFDALTTRDDGHHPSQLRHDPEAQRRAMLDRFPHSAERIEWLLAHRIEAV